MRGCLFVAAEASIAEDRWTRATARELGGRELTDTGTAARAGFLSLPAREIPIPTHLSPEARAQLAAGTMSNPPWPALDDREGWNELIAAMDALGQAGLEALGSHIEVEEQEIEAGNVKVYAMTPPGAARDRVYMDFHGGALLWGGGASCRAMGKIMAGQLGSAVWAVDYHMPPASPFPAAVDDGVSAYRALLGQVAPENVIIGGASAGGNIAAATILKSRDQGLPLPAGAILLTPELDLTESGDTFQTLLGIDTALTHSLMPANLLYANGHDRRDPYVSPLFGDFTKGFPPTFLQSGTRDLFLSNTVLMHRALRRAGVEAELHVFDAATHVMFMAGPEAEDRRREVRSFAERHWGRRPQAR
jgi:epsilon-lactone hydrolase